jgi:membrane fusion protein (multidrug efflux system)
MTTSLVPTTSPPSAPPAGAPPPPPPAAGEGRPPHSRRRVIIGAAGIVVLLLALLALGILPRRAQSKRLAAGVATATAAIPVVSVVQVAMAPSDPTVILPGTLQPMATTSIYSRTPGYIRRILVDIGSHVRAGDLLAVVDAPDLDQQVVQARGLVAQARAALQLAAAELARWRTLSAGGAVTADEMDQKVAAFGMATATLNAAVADLQRLIHLQGFERVTAPFTGVVTQRNVDPGALVGVTGSASTALLSGSGSAVGSLFQVARVDSLRLFVEVPEEYAMSLHVGTPAVVTVPQLPGDTLAGRVTKTSRSLDPTSRTLLTEVDVANRTSFYLPGMYAQAQMRIAQAASPLNVPATALVIRAGPPQVVVVRPDSTVQFRNVQIGRDHGPWVEVTGGIANGAIVAVNPPDDLRDGARVRVMRADSTAAGVGAPAAAPAAAPRATSP